MADVRHEYCETNGIKLHYVTAGDGPLVVLLHGFPEFWYSWRHQIPELAKKFKVVAVDLRGYGDSDKPPNINDYRTEEAAKDIAGLIRSLKYNKAHIVGHDFGGAVAWTLAKQMPEIVDRLAVLNCPHPALFQAALKSNFQQLARSWYIFLFQLPYLPEQIFRLMPDAMIKKTLRGSALKKETFSDADLKRYREEIEKPGSLTAALNYYRAALRAKKESGQKLISAPTLLIWGEKDKALGKELTYGMEPLFSGPFKITYLPECSHWVNEEQPAVVNRLLLDFLT